MIALFYEMNGNLSCIKKSPPVTAWLKNASRVRASLRQLGGSLTTIWAGQEMFILIQTLITGLVFFTCLFEGYFCSIKTLRKRSINYGP